MKKIIAILFIVILFSPMAYAKKDKKKDKYKEGTGVYGTLPEINSEFAGKRNDKNKESETNPPIILNDQSFDVQEKDLRPAPLDNQKYIDVIVKKGTASEYVNDLSELVPILKKMRACIEQEQDIQKFNAIASNYIDNVQYLKTKYKNKPESYYISFEKVTDMSDYVRKVAITRTEALTINKYVAYEESNGVYSPENIKNLLGNTLVFIEECLEAIEEAE